MLNPKQGEAAKAICAVFAELTVGPFLKAIWVDGETAWDPLFTQRAALTSSAAYLRAGLTLTREATFGTAFKRRDERPTSDQPNK